MNWWRQSACRVERANIAGLVQMNDLLMTGKADAEEKPRSVEAELSRLNVDYSERGKQIMSLKMISSQNEQRCMEGSSRTRPCAKGSSVPAGHRPGQDSKRDSPPVRRGGLHRGQASFLRHAQAWRDPPDSSGS